MSKFKSLNDRVLCNIPTNGIKGFGNDDIDEKLRLVEVLPPERGRIHKLSTIDLTNIKAEDEKIVKECEVTVKARVIEVEGRYCQGVIKVRGREGGRGREAKRAWEG